MNDTTCGFRMEVCWSAGWTVYLSGELDAAAGPELEIVASALATAGIAAVDIDLGQVSFIDTAGWICLTAAVSAIEAGGAPTRLRNVHPSLRRLIDTVERAGAPAA